MNEKRRLKTIRERDYVAEVEVELLEPSAPWGPYLSLADATRVDNVRLALRRGDLAAALRLARVYRLTPVVSA